MTDIDYETGFNARAQVPEHPAIFARWRQQAQAWRATAPGLLGLRFGDTGRQALDLFLPEAERTALFIHGGWWRAMERETFSHVARGLNGHGIAVAVTGYDLCPDVTIGEIVEQMRRAVGMLVGQSGRRVTVFGHSAGGHLAAVLASAMPDHVAAGYGISGVFDLAPLTGVAMNADLKLDADTARALSPVHMAPAPFDCVLGGLESGAFKAQSRTLAQRWGAPYLEIEGANHFTVLDPLCDPESAMVARLAEICAKNS